jgi:hypothetical protein
MWIITSMILSAIRTDKIPEDIHHFIKCLYIILIVTYITSTMAVYLSRTNMSLRCSLRNMSDIAITSLFNIIISTSGMFFYVLILGIFNCYSINCNDHLYLSGFMIIILITSCNILLIHSEKCSLLLD